MNTGLIEKTAEETAHRVVLELKKQGMLKDKKETPFQKTEKLLYNYNNFLESVRDREKMIEELENGSVDIKSRSITSFSTAPVSGFTSEAEKKADEIENHKNQIRVTKNFISTIDSALELISGEKYYEIIRMWYFEGKSREEIADYYRVDVKTITRNKNKLINRLQIRLFSDEYITQIFA